MSTHKDNVRKIDLFVKKNEVVDSFYEQNYHFSTPIGWLNDPNGFIYYKEEYHLFYQFNPYDSVWGEMHWGHAKSKDLITWENLPIALAPSEWYDKADGGGCFSGTTIEKNGKIFVFYTGTSFQNGEFVQAQCLATSDDGIVFEKSERNPIVINSSPYIKNDMFRDPKVWEKDGVFYMIVGVSISGKGNALLYESGDLLNWVLKGPLVEDDYSFGSMWECPDIFELNDKTVLIFSPMDYGEVATVYLVGNLNYQTYQFEVEKEGRMDFGYDYYAPQTTLDSKHRRIVIAWQNSWEWMPGWNGFGPTKIDGWCGSMSLPKVIELDKKNNLSMLPIDELKRYESNTYTFENFEIDHKKQLLTKEIYESLLIKVTQSNKDNYTLIISNENNDSDIITVENGVVLYNGDKNVFGKKECHMKLEEATDYIEIYLDSCSIEVIASNGKNMSINNFLGRGRRFIEIMSNKQVTISKIEIKEIIV